MRAGQRCESSSTLGLAPQVERLLLVEAPWGEFATKCAHLFGERELQRLRAASVCGLRTVISFCDLTSAWLLQSRLDTDNADASSIQTVWQDGCLSMLLLVMLGGKSRRADN